MMTASFQAGLAGALSLGALAASAAYAEDADIFGFLRQALGGGRTSAPQATDTLPTPAPDARRFRRTRRSVIRHEAYHARFEPPHRLREVRRERQARRARYAVLPPPAASFPAASTDMTVPDLNGAVDTGFLDAERTAYAETIARKRPGGWLDGRQSLCVRLCDGYAFPVGELGDLDDLPLHRTACDAACPGAATVLFSRPAGGEGLDGALSVG